MRMLGLVGGIGPESTIDYYRLILEGAKRRAPEATAPAIVITSLDPFPLLALLGAGKTDAVADVFVREVERLARAGAELAAICANTPHIVYDAVAARVPIPMVSIVEAACAEAGRRGYRRVGLLGTKFTMQGRFYPDVFSRAGLTIVVPAQDEVESLHRIYVEELLKNEFRPDSRRFLVELLERLRARDGVDAVALAGTELPLLLRGGPDPAVPLLDTTPVHAAAIVGAL
jgi:aspartate racemase